MMKKTLCTLSVAIFCSSALFAADGPKTARDLMTAKSNDTAATLFERVESGERGAPACLPGAVISQPAPASGAEIDASFADESTTVFGTGQAMYTFVDTTVTVESLRFWGIWADAGFASCVPANEEFVITLYGDAGGLPDLGNIIAQETVTIAGVPTGEIWFGIGEVLEYDYVPASPALLTTGWIGIWATDDGDGCEFFWGQAPDALPIAFSPDIVNGVPDPPLSTAGSLAFCLGGSDSPGACCDVAFGGCTNVASGSDCIGEFLVFTPDVTCDDITCVEETGACCDYANAACVEGFTFTECFGIGGTWVPGGTCDDCPCALPCPDGYEQESFDCQFDLNGGCNDPVPSFTTISCGARICGTSFFDGSTRDTDWYEIVLTEETDIMMTVSAESPHTFGVIANGGTQDCDLATGIAEAVTTEGCGVPAMTNRCVPAGTWWLFVGPDFSTVYDCGEPGHRYTLDVDCAPCAEPRPTGACCLEAGGCDIRPIIECLEAGAGLTWTEGAACEDVNCPITPTGNETCDTAAVLECNQLAFANSAGAGTEDGPRGSCEFSPPATPADEDLWYTFTVPAGDDVQVIVTVIGSFDGVLVVYEGGCGGLVEVACSDVGGNDEQTSFTGVAGTTYFIQYYTWNAVVPGGGEYFLEVFCTGPPENDDCDNATEAVLNDPDDIADFNQGTNVGATDDGLNASCTFGGIDNSDVYWVFTAPCDGLYTFDTNQSATLPGGLTDTTLALFDVCFGTELACSEDDGDGLLSIIPDFAMTEGQTVFIRVAGWGTATNVGDIALRIVGPDCGPACPEDLSGDGQVGAADLNLLLTDWGMPCQATPDCVGDLDGDGNTGAADLNLLLTAYGPCP